MATVKQIFDTIQEINANGVHFNGKVRASAISQEIADNHRAELSKHVTPGSLAEKIINSDATQLTEKQLWVIAYDLIRNEEYCAIIDGQVAEGAKIAEQKKQVEVSKKAANKDASAPAIAKIKESGKKLGDYYAWLNNAKNEYRKEYFSKKYSESSVAMFLAL